MIPKGIDVRLLNKIVEMLRTDDLWTERHSYSLRIAYKGMLVASLHLYPGFNEAVLRLYGESSSTNNYVMGEVLRVLKITLPEFKVRVQVLR